MLQRKKKYDLIENNNNICCKEKEILKNYACCFSVITIVKYGNTKSVYKVYFIHLRLFILFHTKENNMNGDFKI